MGRVADRLRGSDLRSIGDANAVSRDLARSGVLVREAIGLLSSDDPVLRSRSADALEKASTLSAEILRPHKRALLRVAASVKQQEVRWHLAQMLPRLELAPGERRQVQAFLREWLDDRSRIVAVCALQALWDMARHETRTQASLRALVAHCAEEGAPSLRARARRLLREERCRRTTS